MMNKDASSFPIKEAENLRAVLTEHNLSQTELAARVGKSNGYLSYRLSLLLLPEDIQKLIEEGEIKIMHARELGKAARRKIEPDKLRQLVGDATSMSLEEFRKKVNETLGVGGRVPRRKARKVDDNLPRTREEVALVLLKLEKEVSSGRPPPEEVARAVDMTNTLRWVLGVDDAEIPFVVECDDGKFRQVTQIY